jgi:ribosomal protein S18 acetylase RimI-like enzyme
VRAAVPGDLVELQALERVAFAGDRPWSAEDVRVELGRGDSLVLAADGVSPWATGGERTATLAAYAVWRRNVDEVELLRVAVHPASRRHGLARLLLTSDAAGVFCGASRVHLEVRESNAPARALYESLGFTEVGKRPRYYGDGEAAVLYARGGEASA